MYEIYADGELMYTPVLSDNGYGLITPKITKEVNKAGNLEFTMAEDHPFYNKLKKLKTIITVFNDEKEVFRGRVMSAETDFYKRKNVYCEGELAFLNDSVVKAHKFNGTAENLFRKYINEHNASVEEYARFTIGTVDISGNADINEQTYSTTFQRITDMISYFGGYISVRDVNGARVIDYRKDAGNVTGQKIEFGVNMLDMTENITAENVYTVVVPIGAYNSETKENVTIEDVNGGCDHIQNDAAVALFGKIWRVYTANEVDDPDELLKKARDYLKKGVEAAVTMTISAVDLHFMDVDTEQFDIGCMVRVVSHAHGIDADYLCSKIELDLSSLDQTKYTFGIPNTDASGVMATAKETAEQAHRGGGGGGRKNSQTEEEVWNMGTEVERDREHIKLLAWANFKQGTLATSTNASLNMTDDQILLEASQLDIDDIDGIVNQVKSSITQTAGSIVSKVEKNGVISAINQTAESVTISASKINLQGYVTASQLSAVSAEINNLKTGVTSASILSTSNLRVGSHTASGWKLFKSSDGNSYWCLATSS